MLKKIILLGLTAVLMTACGTNDSGGASSSGGSGECVDMPSIKENIVGITVRAKYINYTEGKVTYTGITSSFTEEFTDTYSKSTLYDDNENKIMTSETEFFISDGYIKLTKHKVDSVSYNDVEYTFDPYNQAEFRIGKNCKGDTSKSSYVQYEKINGKEKNPNGTKHHSEATIEDVNVEITVPAGTFNTIKILTKLDSSNGYTYSWVDIDTSFTILDESYNKDGKLEQRIETLDIY